MGGQQQIFDMRENTICDSISRFSIKQRRLAIDINNLKTVAGREDSITYNLLIKILVIILTDAQQTSVLGVIGDDGLIALGRDILYYICDIR